MAPLSAARGIAIGLVLGAALWWGGWQAWQAVSDSAVEVRGSGRTGTVAALESFASPPLGLTPAKVAQLTGMLGGGSPVAAGSSVFPPADESAVPALAAWAIYGVQGAGAWACAS